MTLPRLRTRLAARLLCAGFALGLAPTAFAQAPDDTGYDRYRGQSGATGDGSTRVGRAWNDVKKWASDRGTNFTKSFADNGQADPSLMPLSPAILPEFANGNRGPAAAPGKVPSATQPFAPRPQAPSQPPPPLAKHPQSPYAFGGGAVMAGPQGTGTPPAPGVPPAQLAGKPAYNWYGYGSAPATGNPQASQNWIAQTGATAGAFPITAGPPGTVPPPSPPGFVGGPKAVSMIPTIPTIAPPPPTMPVTTAEPPTVPTLKAVPTVTPSPTTAPAAVYTAPAEVPSPKIDEPEWQPAARRPTIEQTAGKADGGRVVPAVAFDANDNEPAWHSAPPSPKQVIPVVKTIERPPALLPVPIPAAPAGVPVYEPVSAPPPVTVPAVSTPVVPVPTLVPVPTAPVFQPSPQPQAPPQPAWQPTAGYQAPVRQPAPVTPPTQPLRAATTTANPSPFPATTGRPSSRPNGTPVPATMANGLAPPPPDAPAPRAIPVSASRELLELERQIRAVTVRTATILEVNEIAPQRFVVKFVAKNEPAARDAASAISALPALRPYAVDFEVRLAGQ